MSSIRTVGELTRRIKSALESEFGFLLVRGQVSNLSRPSSGHIYFSLKDEEATLNAVWFRSSQPREGERFDPLTGEVREGDRNMARELENGMEVLCGGRLTVYPPRGQYQLVAEVVEDMGLGRLYQEFEALKRRLAAKGYFDESRKRPLPRLPRRVAVVTSAQAAALRDFWRVSKDRGLGASMRLYPALVQGEGAPEAIAKALDAANADEFGQVIVLIRGGGSLEDLWAFNSELVADAIYRSRLPVVAGVGHEVDTSIADLVADLRVSTPSHAPQALWPERRELEQRLDDRELELERSFQRFLLGREAMLERLERAMVWLSPGRRLRDMEERLKESRRRLERAMGRCLQVRERELAVLEERLRQAMRPEALARREARLEDLAGRLNRAVETQQRAVERRLELCSAQLQGLDPRRPLGRGYCLVRGRDGKALRSIRATRPGDRLTIGLLDGEVLSRVEDIVANDCRGDDG